MSLLNVTKIHDEPDFLSFLAHPLANMFPMIEGSAFEELKRDITSQGILEPIRLYQGMILDGRNRYAAEGLRSHLHAKGLRAMGRHHCRSRSLGHLDQLPSPPTHQRPEARGHPKDDR